MKKILKKVLTDKESKNMEAVKALSASVPEMGDPWYS
jgi:hypothetical protein